MKKGILNRLSQPFKIVDRSMFNLSKRIYLLITNIVTPKFLHKLYISFVLSLVKVLNRYCPTIDLWFIDWLFSFLMLHAINLFQKCFLYLTFRFWNKAVWRRERSTRIFSKIISYCYFNLIFLVKLPHLLFLFLLINGDNESLLYLAGGNSLLYLIVDFKKFLMVRMTTKGASFHQFENKIFALISRMTPDSLMTTLQSRYNFKNYSYRPDIVIRFGLFDSVLDPKMVSNEDSLRLSVSEMLLRGYGKVLNLQGDYVYLITPKNIPNGDINLDLLSKGNNIFVVGEDEIPILLLIIHSTAWISYLLVLIILLIPIF